MRSPCGLAARIRNTDCMTAVTDVKSPASAPVGEAVGLEARDGSVVFESRGWTGAGESCEPKLAALASLAGLAPPAPVPSVAYVSRGNLLVIAGAAPDRARAAATQLASHLHVTLLADEPAPPADGMTTWGGTLESISGHLGDFTATIAGLRMIPGAKPAKPAPARFDLVLDFGAEPAFAMRMPPQGYFRAPSQAESLAGTLEELREAVGEFESPASSPIARISAHTAARPSRDATAASRSAPRARSGPTGTTSP